MNWAACANQDSAASLIVPGQSWYCYNFEKGVHKQDAGKWSVQHTAGEKLKSHATGLTFVENTLKTSLLARETLLRVHLWRVWLPSTIKDHETSIQWTLLLDTWIRHITITYLTRLKPKVLSHRSFSALVSCHLCLLGGTSKGWTILWDNSCLGLWFLTPVGRPLPIP